MIKILLVNDHILVRTGIKSLLNDVAGFKVVSEASTGEEAITLSKQLLPDVVLMDISMPGIGGLEATVKLQRFNCEVSRQTLHFIRAPLCVILLFFSQE